MRPTRWQSFRQRNRNRPVRQALLVLALALLLFLYGYAFFNLQPDRSHDTIDALNTSLKNQSEEAAKLRRASRQKQKVDFVMNADVATTVDNTTNNNSAPNDPRENSALTRVTNVLFMFYAMALLSRLVRNRNPSGRETRRRLRLLQEQQRQRFQAWAERLNFQRQSNGQQPISMESLQLVMRERDMTGEDYDSLLQFDEEAGPAMEAVLNSVGATQAEIDRCPIRTIESRDDLLTRTHDGKIQQCSVCLEDFQQGQRVRTLPCFHAFHCVCIDPWLAQRALCPVCKHSAIS